jgi:hypothetical protein
MATAGTAVLINCENWSLCDHNSQLITKRERVGRA